jgi:transcriptional regulator with XRE-family HTH domain
MCERIFEEKEGSMSLGERIKALRTQKGWGLRELARRADVRQATLSEIESGKRRDMTTTTAKRIALALGVGVDFLIGTWEKDEELLAAVAV